MSAKSYLDDTEPAVRHLINGLNEYDSLRLPSISKYIGENGVVEMTKSENKAFLNAYKKSFDLDFARATLSGAILQIAYVCLKLHSPGSDDISTCTKFGVKKGSTAEKLCIGRKIHGIPIGLLIYAGRIQYNHWEDSALNNQVANTVFNELYEAYSEKPLCNLIYDISYPTPSPKSYYIVRWELKWNTYEDYIKDIRLLLKKHRPSLFNICKKI